MEYRIALPDGGIRWIASRGRIEFREPGGTPVLARGTSMDVTHRKDAEWQAQRHREEIAHLSRVAMLGELSGSLAHELNQPLTAILSNAQAAQRFLARDTIDRAELQEILRDIVEADKRAGEVIRSLRALFKKGETSRRPLPINGIVRDVLKLVQSDALNHGVSVNAELDEQLPLVSGDTVQLQQVLLNLILNAMDALGAEAEGRRFLFVTTSRASDGGVQIAVRDTGPGVAQEIQTRIFEPFFTTKTQGLGLGLVICRSILEAHGSSLNYRGIPERGAEFFFVLPALEEPA
jgi:C4-dicarboxylate-specific signal transduction histidine kinase